MNSLKWDLFFTFFFSTFYCISRYHPLYWLPVAFNENVKLLWCCRALIKSVQITLSWEADHIPSCGSKVLIVTLPKSQLTRFLIVRKNIWREGKQFYGDITYILSYNLHRLFLSSHNFISLWEHFIFSTRKLCILISLLFVINRRTVTVWRYFQKCGL